MNIHFIQHESFEAPGAYLQWAKSRKHTVGISKVFEGDSLPEEVSDIDLLIVMGGPQSPATTRDECAHFDAAGEIALIQQAMQAGKKVLGICLGAQLIGEAAGGHFEPSPEKEIGVFSIELTAAGLADTNIAHFGPSLPVGHWHSDMPGLTPESKVLARSAGCPRQIIAYSEKVYGFQCHMEFTREVVELLIAAENLQGPDPQHRFVQAPDEIRNFDFAEMNCKLFQFLDLFALK